ncbi:MAG: ABC transporter permease, partial [Anaerolineaceae bacterium]|nr:ABC transporter permease [Anaerolineaceae bacterium]
GRGVAMRKVWIIARLDLLIFLRSRSNVIQLVLVPVVLTLVLGFALGGRAGEALTLRLDVLDEDRSPRSRQLVEALAAQGPTLQVCPAAGEACAWDGDDLPDLDSALAPLRRGDSDGLLQIPAGFGMQLAAQARVVLPFHGTAAVPTADPVWQRVQIALSSVNGAVAADATARALHAALGLNEEGLANYREAVQDLAGVAWSARPVLVEASTGAGGQGDSDIPGGFAQSVPGMATFYALFNVMGGGMAVIMRERREGTLARMATLPLRRREIVAGKILARVVTGILQFAIIFAVGAAIGLDLGRAPLPLILLTLLYVLCVTALGIALAGLIHNDEQVALLSALVALTMAALGGAWWPLSLAPPFMQVIGKLTPVAWAMEGFHQLIWRDGGLPEVLPSLVVLALFCVFFFALGLRLFRYK